MATVTLTDRVIRSLSVEGEVQDFRDQRFRGFGIRVTPRGTKSFFLIYPFNGRRRRMGLGKYPKTSLAKARSKARKALAQVDDGIDPQAEQEESKASDTFEHLAEQYLKLYARPRLSASWLAEVERIIAKFLLPTLGTRAISELRKRDFVLLLDEIVQRGPVIANRTRSVASGIFGWAVGRDLLEYNPVKGVPRPGEEQSRERVLTETELRAVWQACEEDRSLSAIMLQLMIQTAQRGGEIRSMHWEHISGPWWTIPRTKSGRSHRVFLTDQSFVLLHQLDPETGWVFPAGRGKTGHLTRPQKSVDRIRSAALDPP